VDESATPSDPRRCETCGGALLEGDCPTCSRPFIANLIRREIFVLAVLCVAAVGLFLVTRSAASYRHRLEREDAAAWYGIGQRQLEQGNLRPAIHALRRAAMLDRGNREHVLAVATALAANGQPDASRQVLLGLRARAPEDPEVNARLARLSSAEEDTSAAIRYYQNALYGVWGAGGGDGLRALRIEFIRFLLSRGQSQAALAEILVLEANLPDEADWHVRTGRLLLEAGDDRRAAERFARALRLDPRNAEALAGEGTALFRLGEYARSRPYLQAAPSVDPEIADMRALVIVILARDPLLPRLRVRDRLERARGNLEHVLQRFSRCQVPAGDAQARLAQLDREAKAAHDAIRRQGPAPMETIEASVDLVYRLEREMQGVCGPGDLLDRALLIVGSQHAADPS
jgi:tetratricopeptide (TPR) repeat protein